MLYYFNYTDKVIDGNVSNRNNVCNEYTNVSFKGVTNGQPEMIIFIDHV